MEMEILLKGGPAEGKTINIDSKLNYIRIAKIPETDGIVLMDYNSPLAVDVVVESYGYRRSLVDNLIFEFIG